MKAGKILSTFLALPGLYALFALAWLLTIPSDPKNSLLLGLSPGRIAIAVFLVLALMGSWFMAWSAYSKTGRSLAFVELQLKKNSLRWAQVTSLFVIILMGLLCIPTQYLGSYQAIFERLLPVLYWGLAVTLQVVAGILFWAAKQRWTVVKHSENINRVLRASALVLVILLFLWSIIALSGVGLNAKEYWSKAAVPILWPQILIILIVGISLPGYFSQRRFSFDLIFPIVLWLVAFILWGTQNYTPGTFDTLPRPPENQIFPINDAFIFDRAAQKTLIGERILSDTIDKPLFIAQLSLAHLLTGANFSNFFIFQVGFFALIPVIGYFLGRELHSQQLGAAFGLLLLIKEYNAITLTNYISVSTSKMILSEPLTTMLVLLSTLFLVRWLKTPEYLNRNLWLAGGLLGLAGLTRLNSLTILPAALLVIGLATHFNIKKWSIASLILGLFIGITFLPWQARNQIVSGNPLNFIHAKTQGVIVEERYDVLLAQNQPAQDPNNKFGATISNYILLGQKITNHYLHNLISITVMTPLTPQLFNLKDMIRQPYWKLEWAGELQPGGAVILASVFIFIAIGMGTAWVKRGPAGLAPLAVALGYNLSAAIALTSGGRYLVPFEWGMLLYFLFAAVEISGWLGYILAGNAPPQMPEKISPTDAKPVRGMIITGFLFFFLGALPVLVESIPPNRYTQPVTLDAFLQAATQAAPLSADDVSALETLYTDPQARLLHGRLLYPRYYPAGQFDSPDTNDPLLGAMNLDRLTFYFAASADAFVVMPLSTPPAAPMHGTDIWLLGCQKDGYVEAVSLVLSDRIYSQDNLLNSCR